MIAGAKRAINAVRITLGVGGLVALVVGLLILFNPVGSGVVAMQIVTVIFAIYFVIAGLVYIGSMVFSRDMSGWRRVGYALLGLLYLIAGIVAFGNINAFAAVLATFLAIFIGVVWVFEGVLAFTAVKQSPAKALTVIYGIVSIIAGIVLIFSPIFGAVTLWIILGISLVVMGLVQIIRAFQMKLK
ncbi:MAG: hypothetical protein GX814_06710 [Microbacteriaceae bacterium]|nr:hypothetical protein [Microbacteriaceae bacterium]